MSTTAEIIAKLEAEAFDAEETARVWGGESQCAPPLRAAAARLDELERENARLREALQLIANVIHPRFRTEDDIDLLYANEKVFGQCINVARAALAGSGEK
jgi:hypothetical protein